MSVVPFPADAAADARRIVRTAIEAAELRKALYFARAGLTELSERVTAIAEMAHGVRGAKSELEAQLAASNVVAAVLKLAADIEDERPTCSECDGTGSVVGSRDVVVSCHCRGTR